MKWLPLLICLMPMAGHAQAASTWRTVTVSGEGKIKMAPDKAILRFTLQREAMKAADAKKQADALITTLTKIARDAKIADKDINTEAVSLQPQYTYRKNQKPLFTGYIASASISMTVNGLDSVAPLMEAMVKGGIDRFDSISYGLQKEDELKEQALGKALDVAKRKAAMLAQNLGQQIGDPVNISEAGTSYTPTFIAMPAQAQDMRAMGYEGMMAAPPAPAPEPAPPPPPPGELEITSSLSATFALK